MRASSALPRDTPIFSEAGIALQRQTRGVTEETTNGDPAADEFRFRQVPTSQIAVDRGVEPFWTSRITPQAVSVFEIEPILKPVSGSTGLPLSASATP